METFLRHSVEAPALTLFTCGSVKVHILSSWPTGAMSSVAYGVVLRLFQWRHEQLDNDEHISSTNLFKLCISLK